MRLSGKFEEENFIVLPRHSGESRQYIPLGFALKGVIPGDSISLIPNANIFHFGILISNIHMAWMRAVCGRIKGDYRYTSDIVYNNFPWCMPTDVQKATIEKTAQAILDARALYPNCNPDTMPGHCIRIAVWPIYTMKQPCRPNSAKLIKPTIKQS